MKISHPIRKYNVGIVDLHLPVKFCEKAPKIYQFDRNGQREGSHNDSDSTDGFISVRLFYPTFNSVDSMLHFNKDIAKIICSSFMKMASPFYLQKVTFLLDTWQLSIIKAQRNAQPLSFLFHEIKSTHKHCLMPVLFFSHGFMGNAATYNYQSMNLASHGFLVVSINHTDGSAIAMKKHDGSYVPFDPSIYSLLKACKVQRFRK